MQLLRSITAFIAGIWQRGCLGKGAVIFVALIVLGMCGSILGGGNRTPATSSQPTIAPAIAAPATTAPEPTAAPTEQPTTEVLATLATEAPSAEPTIAAAPTDTPAPPARATLAPEPTKAPAPALGAAPEGSSCPADHPVKGNIVDRGTNKGEKIYHLPGDNGYAQTKPERCFVDAKEAEAAGFRPVKK